MTVGHGATHRDRKLGQLIPVSWFRETLTAAFANVDARLASIADEAAPLVAEESDLVKCQRIIDRAIKHARRRLVDRSTTLKRLADKIGIPLE